MTNRAADQTYSGEDDSWLRYSWSRAKWRCYIGTGKNNVQLLGRAGIFILHELDNCGMEPVHARNVVIKSGALTTEPLQIYWDGQKASTTCPGTFLNIFEYKFQFHIWHQSQVRYSAGVPFPRNSTRVFTWSTFTFHITRHHDPTTGAKQRHVLFLLPIEDSETLELNASGSRGDNLPFFLYHYMIPG
jgi:hypothetical protein